MRGRKRTKKKQGDGGMEDGERKKDSSLRAETGSIDRPFHPVTIRCHLRIPDKITSKERNNTESCKDRCLQRRTENYPWEEYLQDESCVIFSYWGRIQGEEWRREDASTLMSWRCERRGRRERHVDEQRRPPFDAHPVVFAAKQSSRVCASDENSEGKWPAREKIGEVDGRLDAKGRRNTFSSSLRPQKRKGREIKMIEGDRRSKGEIHDAPGKTL